ncbi:MAG: FHA domain-containing protein [Rhodocyclaceae bacterium]|nr:MAG: FHA domain-containing protein [Rhodocyclaceae bacterium]TND01309.1 MAG: FHA domain-containing protein [Rhodocyclaceae bacterium]
MVKYYVFSGLFALVMVGVAAQLIHNRRRRPKARAAEAKAAHAVAPAVASAAGPAAAAKEAPYDPNATRIHFRPAPANGHATLPARVEAALPEGAIAKLVCVGGHLKGQSFPITPAGITVGRDPQSTIVLTDHRVSHQHAKISIVDRKVVLRDLDSTNGTFLNAHLSALVHEVVLCPDDTIFFGGHGGDQFRFLVH